MFRSSRSVRWLLMADGMRTALSRLFIWLSMPESGSGNASHYENVIAAQETGTGLRHRGEFLPRPG